MNKIKFHMLSIVVLFILLTGAKGYTGPATEGEREKDYLEMDVTQEDGKYILWRSSEYYPVIEPIFFKSRKEKITRVFISFDHGKTYRDETKRFYVKAGDGKSFQIKRENFPKGDLCIKFRTGSGAYSRESRDYRIRI